MDPVDLHRFGFEFNHNGLIFYKLTRRDAGLDWLVIAHDKRFKSLATTSTNALTPSVQGGGRAPRCRVFRAVQCGELKQTVGSLHTLASQRSTSLTQ